MVDRRWRKYAVTEIEDMAFGTRFFKNGSRPRDNPFFRAKQHARIEVALQRHQTVCSPARFGHRDPPVDAEDICARSRHGFEYRRATVQIKDARNSRTDGVEDLSR